VGRRVPFARATTTTPHRPKSRAFCRVGLTMLTVIAYRISGINRMVFEFTMLVRGEVILCAIGGDGRF